MRKYGYNEFNDTVKALNEKYDRKDGMTVPVENGLYDVHKMYLAMMKRKTATKADIEAIEMMTEMINEVKKHFENI